MMRDSTETPEGSMILPTQNELSNADISVVIKHARNNIKHFTVLSDLAKNLDASHLDVDTTIEERNRGTWGWREATNREKIMNSILNHWRINKPEECTAEHLIRAMERSSRKQHDAFHESIKYLYSKKEKKIERSESALNLSTYSRSTGARATKTFFERRI